MTESLFTLYFLLFITLFSAATSPQPKSSGYAYTYKLWFWGSLAWVVSRKPVARWIIRRAQRTPYTHIPGYMNRWWVFNPYQKANGPEIARIPWLPSIRVHHILSRDNDRHPHDHPWNARTIVLRGWYDETRVSEHGFSETYPEMVILESGRVHGRGYTGPVNHGAYHQITDVSHGGVWTLFFTFGYIGTWGFLVDGVKVPWRDYMAMHPDKPWASDDLSNAIADPDEGRS